MNAQDVRGAFLDFFDRRGHKIVASAPLLPKDDPTLLFTNAGMNPFKNLFLGLEHRSYRRAASVQKCMRVSGKHNDLEQVGRTAKHHTFFEMLGNFSFGDYFKREAVTFAWELMTGTFRLSPERLYATVYEEDDEAYGLWRDEVGLPAARIFRFGKKDNFWAMGETGPCGPCSELHYDLGPDLEPGDPRDLIDRGSDRMVELWNLVFMQFDQDGSGLMRPLPRPSIDTGMGLERMTAVLQGKTSNWETDLFRPLIDEVVRMSGGEYPGGGESDVSARIIADHARAIAFLVGDGIMPANDGRGYVLRRLIRRAYRRGNRLGIGKPFVHGLMGVVAEIMKDAYPELLTSLNFISRICKAEEERFSQTLAAGLKVFQHYADEAGGSGLLAGEAAFKLYDTFGFPLDLTRDLAGEQGLSVDEAAFGAELELQKTRARQSWKGDARIPEKKAYEGFGASATSFAGHQTGAVSEARVIALFKDGVRVAGLGEGESGEVLLDLTPFYAEAGGQVGDRGTIKSPQAAALVESAYYPVPDVRSHRVKVLSGTFREGDMVEAAVDAARRRAVRGNHTATHLLHAALREVLGDHVKQAGSLVAPARLRFDFTHFQALSPGEIDRVEMLVNDRIRENTDVSVIETSLEDGLKSGAMAIFEEKYGDRVRLVSIGGHSRELCGGTHASRTGEIGLFMIVSEASVAAGMRRIEALTGEEAFRHVQETARLVDETAQALNVNRKDLPAAAEKLKVQVREKEHEIRTLRAKSLSASALNSPSDEVRKIKDISVLVRRVQGLVPSEARGLADALRDKLGTGVVVLGSVDGDGTALLVVGVTKDLTGRIAAGAVVKALAPIIGGGGGGRPEFAQAGGPGAENIDRALAESLKVIGAMVGGPPGITPKED